MPFNQIYNHNFKLLVEGDDLVVDMALAESAAVTYGYVFFVVPIGNGDTAYEYKLEYDRDRREVLITDTREVEMEYCYDTAGVVVDDGMYTAGILVAVLLAVMVLALWGMWQFIL